MYPLVFQDLFVMIITGHCPRQQRCHALHANTRWQKHLLSTASIADREGKFTKDLIRMALPAAWLLFSCGVPTRKRTLMACITDLGLRMQIMIVISPLKSLMQDQVSEHVPGSAGLC
jgi:hypothetical protein